jgi:hypothetical protein
MFLNFTRLTLTADFIQNFKKVLEVSVPQFLRRVNQFLICTSNILVNNDKQFNWIFIEKSLLMLIIILTRIESHAFNLDNNLNYN